MQCTEASEVADFQLNEINDMEEKESQKWVPDCSIGECHVPDFTGVSNTGQCGQICRSRGMLNKS